MSIRPPAQPASTSSTYQSSSSSTASTSDIVTPIFYKSITVEEFLTNITPEQIESVKKQIKVKNSFESDLNSLVESSMKELLDVLKSKTNQELRVLIRENVAPAEGSAQYAVFRKAYVIIGETFAKNKDHIVLFRRITLELKIDPYHLLKIAANKCVSVLDKSEEYNTMVKSQLAANPRYFSIEPKAPVKKS